LPAPLGGLIRTDRGVCIVSPAGVTGLDGSRVADLPDIVGPDLVVNDAKVDPWGRLWLAMADPDEREPVGGLVRVGFGSAVGVEQVVNGVIVGNGPAFAPDGSRAYFSDSMAGRVLAIPLGNGGRPTGPATEFFDCTGVGSPDGLTVAADGSVWIALWGGWAVLQVDSDGQPRTTVRMPVAQVSSVAIEPGTGILLVTSALGGLSASEIVRQPLAGSTFCVETDAVGIAEPMLGSAAAAMS
jgi:sugar lactone lactonase YvrE